MTDNHPVLLLSWYFPPEKGGTAVSFEQAYSRMGGKEIHVVCADHGDTRAWDAAYANTPHRLKMIRYRWLKPESLVIYLKFLWTGFVIMLTKPIQAVHAGRVLPEGLVGWFLAKLFRKPLIIFAHGEEITTWLREPGKSKAMLFAYRNADAVIANSIFTKEILLSVDIPEERIHVIYCGVDQQRFTPGLPGEDLRQNAGIPEGRKIILSVGRLTERKGFDAVIKALPGLVKQGIDPHFVIIGAGPDRALLEELAQTRQVADRVHFAGQVSDEDLPRWFCLADLFTLINRRTAGGDTEGFGRVYIEAAACGRTSIAGADGGTGDAVLDGETGLRIDGADPDAVEEALARLLTDDAQREELAAAALKRVRREFTPERFAQEIRRLSEEMRDAS